MEITHRDGALAMLDGVFDLDLKCALLWILLLTRE